MNLHCLSSVRPKSSRGILLPGATGLFALFPLVFACQSDPAAQKTQAPAADAKQPATDADGRGESAERAENARPVGDATNDDFEIVDMTERALKLDIKSAPVTLLTSAADTLLNSRGLLPDGQRAWVWVKRDSKAPMRTRVSRLIDVAADRTILELNERNMSQHFRESVPPLSDFRSSAGAGESGWAGMATGELIRFPPVADLAPHQRATFDLLPVDGGPPLLLAQVAPIDDTDVEENPKRRKLDFEKAMYVLPWTDGKKTAAPVFLAPLQPHLLSGILEFKRATALGNGETLLGAGGVGVLESGGACVTLRWSKEKGARCILHQGTGRMWQSLRTGQLVEVTAKPSGEVQAVLGLRLADGTVHPLPDCGRNVMDFGAQIAFGCRFGLSLWDGAREYRFPRKTKVDLQGRVSSLGKRTLRMDLGERGGEGVKPYFLDTKTRRAARLPKSVVTYEHLGRWALTVPDANRTLYMVDGETMSATKLEGLACDQGRLMTLAAASATHWVFACQGHRDEAKPAVFVVEHSSGKTVQLENALLAATGGQTILVTVPSAKGATDFRERRLARFVVKNGAPFSRR